MKDHPQSIAPSFFCLLICFLATPVIILAAKMQSQNENGFLFKVSEYNKYPPLKKLQVERKIPYAQPSVHEHKKIQVSGE